MSHSNQTTCPTTRSLRHLADRPARRGHPTGTRARDRPFGAGSLLALLVLMSFTSCATIVSDYESSLRIDSDLPGSTVEVYDADDEMIFTGETPCEVTVDHGRAYFLPAEYRVVVSSDGHPTQETRVETSIDEWYLGNAFIPGGLVGSLLVDPWTGAMYELDTNDVTANFVETELPGDFTADRGTVSVATAPQ